MRGTGAAWNEPLPDVLGSGTDALACSWLDGVRLGVLYLHGHVALAFVLGCSTRTWSLLGVLNPATSPDFPLRAFETRRSALPLEELLRHRIGDGGEIAALAIDEGRGLLRQPRNLLIVRESRLGKLGRAPLEHQREARHEHEPHPRESPARPPVTCADGRLPREAHLAISPRVQAGKGVRHANGPQGQFVRGRPWGVGGRLDIHDEHARVWEVRGPQTPGRGQAPVLATRRNHRQRGLSRFKVVCLMKSALILGDVRVTRTELIRADALALPFPFVTHVHAS